MAHVAPSRSAVADLGGKFLQDHRLVHDTARGIRYSDQRSSSNDTAQGSTPHTGSQGSGQSATEEAANEDDDEDSSGGKDDDQEDEEDDPEVLAPSHGLGKGKGKRPAIRIEPAGEDESQDDDDDETASRETGPKTNKHSVDQLLMSNKKRTFSNISNTSVLFGENDNGPLVFPRPKMARKLSYSGGKGLLTYKESADNENAIETSDEEKDAEDDEDYSGVNMISEDESDMETMEQREEQFIIHEEEQHAIDLFSEEFDNSRRASLGSYCSDDIFNLAMPKAGNLDDFSAPDYGFSQLFEPEPLPASPGPIAKRKFSDSSTKRVRFDDEVQVSDSSSSSSSELDSATFPDLFMEQDKLPPSLYQLMQQDDDTDNEHFPSSGSEHSYWDVGQDETRNLVPRDPNEFDESSDPGSSGYETDMGDTTDEYDSDFGSDTPPQTPRQKSVLRRPSSAPGSKAASPKPFLRVDRANAIPPLRGLFIHEDSRQAIAVTNPVTKALTFYRPRASISLQQPNYGAYSSSASTANNSPRTSVQQLNASDSELSNDVFSNAFIGSDIMLTGLFGSAPANPYLFGGENIGPPEAFYPFINIAQNGNIISDEDEYDDEDYEDDLDLADFMDFGSDVDATDEEQEEETDVPATPATSMVALNGFTPAQPTPMTETPSNRKRNVSDAMLEHFDRAGVTAFRNNQNRYRDLACLPHDPDLRASVSRPIRSGKSAETLISPLRKRSSMSKKHGSSTFAGVTKATSRLQSSVMNSRRGPRLGTFS